MGTPVYVGNAKKGKWEGSIQIGFNKEHLKTLADNLSETGWVNLIVSPQRENRDKFSVKIDDWKPNSAHKADERAEQERQGFQPNDSLESPGGKLPF
jgi:hypothetical protein